MKKPERLRRGDKVAVVSLSCGMLGDPEFIHKYDLAKERMEQEYGLQLVAMPNALKGTEYLDLHPEARAKDLMDAFSDKTIKGVICAIGGEDTIRLLPYIDFNVLKRNPKIFMGFSDTTTNHFMMAKAGIVSYYGGSLISDWAEYVKINDYTAAKMRDTLFEPKPTLDIPSSPFWSDDEDEKIWWKEENMDKMRPYHPEEIGYEILQGKGAVEGELFGGCADVFIELFGTPLWPKKSFWKNKILFVETSEENMPGSHLRWILLNMAAQGIFDEIKGIVVGKPARRSRYEEYKEVWKRVIGREAGHPELPILYNFNIGHAAPIGILPYGVKARLDADNKTLTLLEPATR